VWRLTRSLVPCSGPRGRCRVSPSVCRCLGSFADGTDADPTVHIAGCLAADENQGSSQRYDARLGCSAVKRDVTRLAHPPKHDVTGRMCKRVDCSEPCVTRMMSGKEPFCGSSYSKMIKHRDGIDLLSNKVWPLPCCEILFFF
jgi:hypothetical protein